MTAALCSCGGDKRSRADAEAFVRDRVENACKRPATQIACRERDTDWTCSFRMGDVTGEMVVQADPGEHEEMQFIC